MSEQLNVEIREIRGKRRNRRLRKTGVIPAILYGHKEQELALSVPESELSNYVHGGQRVVQLAGAVDDMAFIREVQWDTWGDEILHVDFARVSADESVEVDLVVEIRGEAPGAKEGGVVSQQSHQIQVRCPLTSIPEKLSLSINTLELNESITAGQLELPEGAELLTGPDTTIVQCMPPMEEVEDEEGADMSMEPEVIGAKKDDEEE